MTKFGGFVDIGKIGEWFEVVTYRDSAPAHECPQCGRLKHSAPLTEWVNDMLNNHHFEPDYDPDEDSSLILCVYPGEGPAPTDRLRFRPVKWDIDLVEQWSHQVNLISSYWAPIGVSWDMPQPVPQPKAITPPKGGEVDILTFDEWKLGDRVPPHAYGGVAGDVAELLSGMSADVELPQYEVDYQPIIDKVNKPGYVGVL